MIDIIEQYQTKDKKIFNSLKKAEDHVRDLCCVVLEKRLRTVTGPIVISKSQETEVILQLVGTVNKAKDLCDALNKILN